MDFRKKQIFTALLLIVVSVLLILLFRNLPYFDTRCLQYRQKDFSRRLNDRLVDYAAEAKRTGITVCKDEDDLRQRISDGGLVRVSTGRYFVIEKMNFSSPYVTPETKALLNEIARRFRRKVSEKGLRGARLIITSMTRQAENVRDLKASNSNSSINSPHLYGNAFDISYKRIIVRKFRQTNCDNKYLKDALGEIIWELRQERKCWATYERMQNCFHVVAR